MARLSLTPESARLVAEWKAKANSEDWMLVSRVLAWAGNGLNGIQFHCIKDSVDKTINIVEPRDHLFVLIRMWPLDMPDHPNQFEVLGIFEDPDKPESDGLG
jgi:hypothetical protein